MVSTLTKPLTLEEFLQQPETKPASEYIDGQIIQKPMPSVEHSAIQGDLVSFINAALRSKKIARAFPELRCNFGDRAIVPDVSVYTWEKISRNENGKVAGVVAIAPDWLIEILSPEQSQTKVIKKIVHALKYDTQMGWLINPYEESILVYSPDKPTEIFDEPDLVLPVPEFAKELELTVGDLFAWLLE
ncbi:MAG: Uma2 family endonuclease [Cyanobacteria bacterium SBLK]|nr:Uma2 family endonuclease [Cyanobacteria bacterium SBLK]